MNNPVATLNGNTASMFFALMKNNEVESLTLRLAKKSIDRRI